MLPLSSPHTAVHRYGGHLLNTQELELLTLVAKERAMRVPQQITPELHTLLRTELLFSRMTDVGVTITLGYAGAFLLGLPTHEVPRNERAANIVYFREALALAEERGYDVLEVETLGRAWLSQGGIRHLLLARASAGGYTPKTITVQMRRAHAMSSYSGTVIVTCSDTERYARLVSFHSRLRVWPLALQAPPTRAHTARSRPDTAS